VEDFFAFGALTEIFLGAFAADLDDTFAIPVHLSGLLLKVTGEEELRQEENT
jgi:hypothetical protein